MTVLGFTRSFLAAQLLLVLGYVLARALCRTRWFSQTALLWTARAILIAACALPLLMSSLPAPAVVRAPVQVWSGTSVSAERIQPVTSTGWGQGKPMTEERALPLATIVGSLLGLAALFGAARLLLAHRRLGALVREAPLWRRFGRIELRVSSRVATPFAARWKGRAIVVLDHETLTRAVDRKVAITHELQHHRQGDVGLAMPFAALLALSYSNPFAHAWARLLRELEELACDEAVLRTGRVPIRDYGECLLRAARRAVAEASPLTIGLTHRARRSALRRRIMMMTERSISSRPLFRLAAWCTAGVLLAVSACVADDLVEDHRVSESRVADVASRMSHEAFVVPSHPVVVDAVNRLAATPDGRRFLRGGLARMPAYESAIHERLDHYGLPRELAAIPLIESGYENLGAGVSGKSLAPGIPGKGIWMFIPSTARAYGLQVDDEVDQRLDVALETDAAMRLLADLHRELGDWGLALAAYNQGARHVREAIARHGTRDVWELTRIGALNGYAAQVMAAILVMNEPALVGGP
jgi:beta-lactamase regulating signal transducer with metallopeptidase domain